MVTVVMLSMITAFSSTGFAQQSLSSSLGLVPYPSKGQSAEQQGKDEGECYGWAKQQTGIDPTAVASTPPPPSGPIRYYEFKTLIGRTLAAFLAVGSTVMIASITALLASTFTLDQMHSKISGPQDLAEVKVGVMEASTSFEYLQERDINGHTFGDRQELLNALDSGKLDAVVGDDAVLKYKIKMAQAQGRYETLSVLPFTFEKQNYAFALPDESPHVELLNQALLAVLDTAQWKAEIARYIGQ